MRAYLLQVASDPETFIPMFRRDPLAFVLEIARLYPAVSGISYYVARETKTYVLDNGQ